MANLSKALNTDMAGLAQILRKKGRGKDSVLAHITPKEAALLKARGGSGTTNPDTGLPEFDDGFDYSSIPDVASQQDPAVLSSGGESLSPQQAAAANPNLYGGGQLPTANQTTNFNMPPELQGLSNAQINQYYAQPTGSQGQRPSPAAFTGEYTGDAMGGPASVGPATAFGATGKPVDVASAYQLTPDQTGVQQVAQPTTSADVLKTLKGLTPNLSNDTLMRLGLAGGLGLLGVNKQKQAADQNQAAVTEQKAIAAPYQQQGQNLIQQAQSGSLSPASQAAYAAAQAQLAQAQSGRGGVGAQQTANQMATLYQTLLNNQYTYGLQVAQIGDAIATGAIKQGLTMDQQLNTSTQNFYTNLAAIASGLSPGARTVSPTGATT
jgi:hypothetical protein